MSAKPIPQRSGRFSWWRAGAVLLAAWSVHSAAAQNAPSAEAAPAEKLGSADSSASADVGKPATPDSGVTQAGCSSCGSGMPAPGSMPAAGGMAAPCGVGCYPGRTCTPGCCDGTTCIGKLFCGLHDCICCPDPCYEPKWVPVADSAFFVDAARPKTQMRLRWDSGFDFKDADRAEYFWARESVNQIEPQGPCTRHGFGKGPGCIPRRLDHEDLSLYMEGAGEKASVFVETPYKEIGPETSAISPSPCCNKSGFGDLIIGTKSLLLDCELVQITFQFKTFIPTGDFTNGLGTGHVSLEPSILFNLKISPVSYLQGQFSYWIPIGGDDLYQGNIYHMHFSYNHVLWHLMSDVLVVGTAELNEWSVLGGNYTSSDILIAGRPVPVSATTEIVSAGPGIRLFICDKIDIGVGTAFALTGRHWEEELIRAEFRWRF